MTETERYVLRAAADMPREEGRLWRAQELYDAIEDPELEVQDVSFALLRLRDQGYVVTEPTVGDPMDGIYRFRLTPEGSEAAVRVGSL